jgi:hypothetical protein
LGLNHISRSLPDPLHLAPQPCTNSQAAWPFGPTQPAGPSITYHTPLPLTGGPRRSAPFRWFLFPFLALSRADAVGQGRRRERRRQPWAPPPAALAPRDGGHVPPEPHPSRSLPCPETLALPYKYRFPASSPKNPPPPMGIPPCPPQEGEEEGEKEKSEERRTGKPHWGSPTPSRRWTNWSPPVLQARPPDGGRPCVDRGAGAVQAADDRPFTEPNPLLPLHRAVRLPQPEPR